MRKLALFLAIFLLPSLVLGAVLAKEIKSYEYIAQIYTPDQKTMYVYKFNDNLVDCYVSYSSFSQNSSSQSISCVKVR